MAEHVDKKVLLSWLADLDLEMRQREQERRGFRYLKELIEGAQQIENEVAGLARTKSALQADVAVESEKLRVARSTWTTESTAAQDAADKEKAALTKKLAPLKKQVADLEATIRERETFAAARAAQLGVELATQVETLAKAKAAMDDFKKAHGL